MDRRVCARVIEKCSECDFMDIRYDLSGPSSYCEHADKTKEIDDTSKIPEWCPLSSPVYVTKVFTEKLKELKKRLEDK